MTMNMNTYRDIYMIHYITHVSHQTKTIPRGLNIQSTWLMIAMEDSYTCSGLHKHRLPTNYTSTPRLARDERKHFVFTISFPLPCHQSSGFLRRNKDIADHQKSPEAGGYGGQEVEV